VPLIVIIALGIGKLLSSTTVPEIVFWVNAIVVENKNTIKKIQFFILLIYL
jgi:hypothetical protein